MTGMRILGVGGAAFGMDEPYADGTAMLSSLPIKDIVPPKVSRRYGRLSKMVVLAVDRALRDAGLETLSGIPVVAATAVGETKASLGILEQIHETDGVRISPALVPNSVHNAAAGYLLIANKTRTPSITVSQGWLSAEAALAAAEDMVAMGHPRVVVVSGDEADPAWIDRLQTFGATALADSLRDTAFQEGAAAMVLGGPTEGDAGGRRIRAAVERMGAMSAAAVSALLDKYGIHPTALTTVRLRKSGGGELLMPVVTEALGHVVGNIHLDGVGPGTVQSAPLATLAGDLSRGEASDQLFIAREAEELGLLYYKEGP